MHSLSARALLPGLLAFFLTSVTASSPSIGLATAPGNFQVNAARIWGNTTLFDGSLVETAKVPSLVSLNSGARMRLATESRARVYQGRLVLERGSGQMESPAGYAIEARSLRVYGDTPRAMARVQLSGAAQVIVSALKGDVRVTNSSGVLIARLGVGKALSFDPQAGATGPTQISGCLFGKDGKFILVDRTANVPIQVQGDGLEKEVRNQVEISGAVDVAPPSVAGASQLVNVVRVKRLAKGGCASAATIAAAGLGAGAGAGAAAGAGAGAAAGAGAGAAAGAAAGAGIGAATIAVIGGVAVAGAVGGMAAAGTFSGSESAPGTSR